MKVYSKNQLIRKISLPAVVMVFAFILIISCGNPEQKPVGLGYHAMAYDSESAMFIIYGGQVKDFAPPTATDITWAYDCRSKTWTKMDPEIRPPKIAPHGMVYDSGSDLIVLFTGDTWTYDYNTNTWEKHETKNKPKGVNGFRMAYDSESDRTILFGGAFVDETWAYDTNGDNWEKMAPKNNPGDRLFHSMTYDSGIDRIVLFGGSKPMHGTRVPEKVYNDTWLYDYNSDTWEKSTSDPAPVKRLYHRICYCEALGKSVLFGGYSYDKQEVVGPEVWAYDGKEYSWSQLKVNTILKPLRKHEMSVIPGTRSLIIVGGTSALYENEMSEPRFSNEAIIVEIGDSN